jgi:lipopolysaccharide export system protein LptA
MQSPKEFIRMKSRFFSILISLLWICSFHQADLSMAQNTADSKNKDAQETPIEITADKLITNSEKQYAEFIGNVRATQEGFVITSGSLRIYYEGNLVDPGTKASDSGKTSLKKIVATKNVKIVSEQYTATSDRAEYDLAGGIIILSGEDATVVSGKNSLSGNKIVLNQKSGEVKVEGGPQKRVKAVFYSGGGGSDPFKIGPPQGEKEKSR